MHLPSAFSVPAVGAASAHWSRRPPTIVRAVLTGRCIGDKVKDEEDGNTPHTFLCCSLNLLSRELPSLSRFYDGVPVRMDNDNMIKPIQDALIGLVYTDDRWITDTRVRRSDLNGSFRVKYMSLVLAEGFHRGQEFLYIKVEDAPNHEELL